MIDTFPHYRAVTLLTTFLLYSFPTLPPQTMLLIDRRKPRKWSWNLIA